ncbi:hypothetical protein EHS25_003714 [Saitozyma podzolica]|uniref:Myb-like domain-containing protein n=1 Tax=Saitozyma podzolica TaxID=1890683 RepID=A0A427Y3G7_9TREE|nr:hypothetical protein EHS25_003714 [Saitozyma podzolica]
MPRTPKTPTNNGIKTSLAPPPSPSPYPDTSPISSAKSSATSPRRARASTTLRPWTSEELVKLFDTVAKRGAVGSAFDGLIEGRTGASCYSTWNNTVVPYIKKALEEKGKNKKAVTTKGAEIAGE